MLWLLYLILSIPILITTMTLMGTNHLFIKGVNAAGSILTSTLLLMLIHQVYVSGPLKSDIFYVDELSALLLLIIALLTFTTTLFSISYMEHELHINKIDMRGLRRYYALLNVFSFTMICVLIVENLGMMWVAIEATTLASALLVAFYLHRLAIEAAWKYVMVCTVGICLALLGTILLYYAQVNTNMDGEALSWLVLRNISPQLDAGMVKLAFVFILIGYGTKIGLAPMHTWLPDAHSQAPSPISGLLSGALLSCALYVLIRNIVIVKEAIGFDLVQHSLIALGFFSIIIAIPFILVQNDLKRLLAYSSVEHMGIITIALGIGTLPAVYGALLHIFNHAVAKSGLFFLVGAIMQEYRTKHIMRIRGIITTMPLVGTIFVLAVLIITGIPPFGIFVSKFMITWAAFADGDYLLGGLLLLLLGNIFAGMMYYCCKMVFSAPAGVMRTPSVSAPAIIAIMLSVAITMVSGFYLPAWIGTMLNQAAAVVMGG